LNLTMVVYLVSFLKINKLNMIILKLLIVSLLSYYIIDWLLHDKPYKND
jgi:hypothetical protein